MKITEKDIVSGIIDDLKISKIHKINEAYVVSSQNFDYNVDIVGDKTKLAHQKLLNGYVDSLNRIAAELDTVNREDANSTNSIYRSFKIDEVYNLNAAFLHGMFFENITESSTITVDSLAFLRLERDFGSFNDWQKDFIATAQSARSGWAVTVYNTFLRRYINVVVDSHSNNVPFSSYPVIVVDMWEHAYFDDYLNDKKKYIFAVMKQLDWQKINERVQRAEDIGEVFR
jgi:Fe-Mn family superoxide dismutase